MVSNSASSHWVFGYGSLIWRPGFAFERAERALLPGAHRSLCIYSHHYRGTPERPGLVFGLRPGGSCNGMAFEVSNENWPAVLDYLRRRELMNNVYHETQRPVRFDGGETVQALTFMANQGNSQFAGRLTIEEQARLVLMSRGEMGPNVDYVVNTARHLKEMGITDRQLEVLAARLTSMPLSDHLR